MNCDNCEHNLPSKQCAWGKNPHSCGRNFPTLDDFYETLAKSDECGDCQHFTYVGEEHGTCHVRYGKFPNHTLACKSFCERNLTCYQCSYCLSDKCYANPEYVASLPDDIKPCKLFFYYK